MWLRRLLLIIYSLYSKAKKDTQKETKREKPKDLQYDAPKGTHIPCPLTNLRTLISICNTKFTKAPMFFYINLSSINQQYMAITILSFSFVTQKMCESQKISVLVNDLLLLLFFNPSYILSIFDNLFYFKANVTEMIFPFTSMQWFEVLWQQQQDFLMENFTLDCWQKLTSLSNCLSPLGRNSESRFPK